MKSPRFNQDVLIFSQLADMKFKPSDCPLLRLSQQNHPQKLSQLHNMQSTISHFNNPNSFNKRIKYLHSLNQYYFLIGNQNQLDLIGINGSTYGFLETEYLWSINLKQILLNLTVDVKKCFLALVLQKSVKIFSYNPKKFIQPPQLFKTIQTKNQVKFIQFAKESYLSIFYAEYFEVYIIEDNGTLVKKCQKSYGLSSQYKIFAVPQAADSVLNIFFEKQTSQKLFSLWSMKVVFQLIQVKVFPIGKVYDIMKSLKKRVRISNFSKDTFFMNMGCEIIAAKKGFIIDSISINFQKEDSRLIYLSNQRLLHIDEDKVQLYEIKIDLSVKPNRIRVKSIDSLEIQKRPQQSKLIDVISLGKDNFAIFFQQRPQYNIYKKGEVNYWFAITESIKKEQKISKIFNYGQEISTLSQQIIEARCDMARKIGLEQKQIFLQIWNRTSKSTVEDYKFLLATKDYKIIYNQIQKKLKKQSMSFRQLFNIFKSCLDILTKNVFSKNFDSQYSEETIQEYLTCHLLVRKLKLFKEVEIHERNHRYILTKSQTEQQSSQFMINIQSFYEYKNLDIKGYLIDHVNMFCVDKKNTIHKIRLILRAFRFVYRVIYREILDEIIVNAKSNLLSLLQAIPQLLPHNHSLMQNEESELYEGIWKDISESEWESNIYYENIKTIDNFQKVDELIKSVWYKRYWLTAHDLVNLSKNQILSIHNQNVSQSTFYYFISSIFMKIQDQTNLNVVIQFLENFYDNLPSHIKGKIFLYVDLWKYYCQHHKEAKRQKLMLNEFFMLKGPQLFKYFFDLQKVRKNCILKEIKPIYLSSKTQYPGIDVFNQALLEYFQSDMSQISDLKYLLNRMNNQKSQFHGKNAETYEILIQAMQIKMVIGGPNDVPIEQTLIYIENIPLNKDNDAMAELEIVKKINEESQRFRQMKLNMTIRQIIDNCEDVIFKLIQYQCQKHHVGKIDRLGQLKKVTYSILAQVQTVKQKIYGQNMNNLPFFTYISQILQNQDQIALGGELLHDEFLNRYFVVNETVIENLVLYMYKKRFSLSSLFKNHETYIKKLVKLLPQQNTTRKFIQSELQFALLLSSKQQCVRFPISNENAFPKVNQLRDIVNRLSGDFIKSVDINKVYQAMTKMQKIELQSAFQDDFLPQNLEETQMISLHQVYEIFIARLIQLNQVHKALLLIQEILQIQFPNKIYNTVYLIDLILKLSPELNDECKNGLINLVRYKFDSHQEIISMISFYLHEKITSLQKGNIINRKVKQQIFNCLNYNVSKECLFKQQFITQASKNQKLSLNANLLVQSTWQHIKNTKPQFKDPFYEIVFIILCHQPFMLTKLIQLQLYSINLKQLRSFISYLSIEEIFDQFKILQLSRRIFFIVLHSRMENEEINHKLFNIEKIPLDAKLQLKQYHHLLDQNDQNLQKSIKACQNKSKVLLNPVKRSRERQSDHDSIQIKIHFPENITSSEPSQYPYNDSDDEKDQEDHSLRKKKQQNIRKSKIIFDEKSERNKFMKREGKKLGTYMKEQSQLQNQSSNNTNEGFQTFKIKSRIVSMSFQVDKQSKIQKAMTLTYDPEQSRRIKLDTSEPSSPKLKSKQKKKMVLNLPQSPKNNQQTVMQSPIYSQMKKKLSKRKSSEQINSSREKYRQSKSKQKQKSSYKINPLIRQSQTAENTIQYLLQEYDDQWKKFNLERLSRRKKQLEDNPEVFTKELQQIISVLYENIENQTKIRMELIKSIVQAFEQSGVKMNIFAVYSQFMSLIQRYNLNLSVKSLLPNEALFMNISLSELFELSKSKVIQMSTLDNLSKLSKVVSFAFRNNVYEQQIAYHGLAKILNELQSSQDLNQVQVNLCFDQIYQIVTKLSTKMLRQKGQQQFKQINDGPVKNKLINMIIRIISNKGDRLSVNALKKALKIESDIQL